MKQRISKAVLMFLALGFLLTLMVYTQPFGKGTIARLAALLPFPAASVNGRPIFYARALERYNGLKTFYASEGREVGGDFEERVFESLLRETLVRRMIRERGVFVSKEEPRRIMRELQDQAGDERAFQDEVKSAYGWSLREFERHVARPFAEAKILEEAILKDRDLQSEKRTRIDEAFEKLRGGAAFDGLVLEYSEDATSVFNGDVGWMSEAELPEAWRGPALHLDIGETSPVLEERDRFVILRVDDREDSGLSLSGVSGSTSGVSGSSRVNLSVLIVNKISLSEVVQDFAEESKVEVWVRL